MKILDEQKSNIGHNKSTEIGNTVKKMKEKKKHVYVKEIVIITKTNFNTFACWMTNEYDYHNCRKHTYNSINDNENG